MMLNLGLEKVEMKGFGHWLKKGSYYSVQPPIGYLQDMVTFRIHSDKCTAQNGALKGGTEKTTP